MAFNLYKGIAEFFTPVLTKSHFQEKGVLTPEEFVAAGDLLVLKCPTWSWATGDESKVRPFLPKDKQFLITKNVPCLRRARSLERNEDEHEVEDGDWLDTSAGDLSQKADDVEEIPSDIKPKASNSNNNNNNDDDDECPDISEFDEDNNIAGSDEATLDDQEVKKEQKSSDDNILKTRTYDISITYDKYYQTPRVWLFGYDENGKPLKSEQILEDIYADYANKTVTIETHPHLNVSHASIHPCRHAEVMKKMIDMMAEDGKYVRVDLYLFLFLKFIRAVIPTIQYDFTVNVDTSTMTATKK